MAMVCSRCSTSHEQAIHCPTCGNALTYVVPRKCGRTYADLTRGWQHTDWGRFLIGVGLAQGLFYGLFQLLKSLYLAVTGESLASAGTLPELVCIESLQLFGLLVGSVIAGVARKQAIVLGVYIGVVNSILALLLKQWPGFAFTNYWAFAQPLVQIVVGAIGALVSSLIWKPLTVATLPESPSRMAAKLGAKRPRFVKWFAGSIVWYRVMLGTLFAVAGLMAVKPLLARLADHTDLLAFNEHAQEVMVLWQLRALVVLMGGFFAGAGTPNGLKQGIVTGIVTGAVMNIVLAFQGTSFGVVTLSMVVSFALALVGGWFGSQLFPPLGVRRRLNGVGPSM